MRGLICIHGLLSSKVDFIRIEPSLRNLYDWIETSDLPGHGMNPLKFNTQNVKNYILNIYDRMAVKCDEIDVIGYSMGGVIACYLQSVRYVRKLVLLSPAYRYLNLKNYHFSSSKKTKTNISTLFPRKNYMHIFRFAKIISDLSDEFSVIYPETLILWGTEDYLVKEESGRLLYQMIRNRNKRWIQLKNHNHFNILHSNTVIQLTYEFLV